MDFSLSDEQRDFVAAIEDFCRRECGARSSAPSLTRATPSSTPQDIYGAGAFGFVLGSADRRRDFSQLAEPRDTTNPACARCR